MRTILYTLLTLSLATSSIAQKAESSLTKQANIEFSEMRYAYAIPLYKRLIQLNAKDINAHFKLAKCYQINNQYDSAIKYSKLAAEMGANLGNMLPELLANKGDYKNAIAAYSKVNSPVTSIRQKGFTNLESYSENELNYTIHYLAINTAFNELAPVSFKNGLVFESNRANKINGKNEFSWDGSAYSKLYFTTNKDTIPLDSASKLSWIEKPYKIAISDLAKQTVNDANKIFTRKFNFKKIPFQKNEVVYFDEDFNSKFNVGAICFSSDSNTAYFTRNQELKQGSNINNENHLLEIWSTTKVDDKFSNFMKLPFNNINASYFHPALSKNEKRLYFISDQEGGKGGADLYYVDKDAEGNWGSPINAGDKVNTAGSELYPTIADSNLHISSNGHEGLGGLDIYKVIFQKDKIIGVENLGLPINSATDDMSFTKTKNIGYFISNRYGTDDIFSYEYALKKIKLNGKVLTSDGSKPIITVKLYALNPQVLLDTKELDQNSNYSFSVPANTPLYILAAEPQGNKADMTTNSKGYQLTGKEYVKSVQDLIINIPAPKPVVIAQQPKVSFNNIIDSLKSLTKDYVQLHHIFDRTKLMKEELKAYNSLVKRVKSIKNARIIVVSAADCMGNANYNEKLSSRRSDAITAQLRKRSKNNTYVSLHLGERVLVEACDIQHYSRKKQRLNRYTYVFIQK
jgi:outer membrane protein OmpA-like peptidoglycan-associated protein